MSILPDELWNRILETGTSTSRLGYRDLCCLAIASRRLNRLSQDASLWAGLLAVDFPSDDPPQSPSKSLYKTKYERDKARRVAAWRRAVLGAESQVDLSRRRLAELEDKMVRENARLKAAVEEIANLERVKRASVALKSNEKKRFSEYKEAVTSLKYHPLQTIQLGPTIKEPRVKGKKLKLSESSESSR